MVTPKNLTPQSRKDIFTGSLLFLTGQGLSHGVQLPHSLGFLNAYGPSVLLQDSYSTMLWKVRDRILE